MALLIFILVMADNVLAEGLLSKDFDELLPNDIVIPCLCSNIFYLYFSDIICIQVRSLHLRSTKHKLSMTSCYNSSTRKRLNISKLIYINMVSVSSLCSVCFHKCNGRKYDRLKVITLFHCINFMGSFPCIISKDHWSIDSNNYFLWEIFINETWMQ